ncbi:MAG: winged helix-turn-helix domain-containing protein [Dysgonomonas sp.]|nr:winged helix-turn-helix domain-containing protein [Dysgonomonas sp.]
MLKVDIGFNAGNILALLSERGKLSLREIGEATHYKDIVISLAIGWLLRENKIQIHESNGKLFFELNNCFSEIYYS